MKAIQAVKAAIIVRGSNSTPASRLHKVMRKRLRIALERARASALWPIASGQ